MCAEGTGEPGRRAIGRKQIVVGRVLAARGKRTVDRVSQADPCLPAEHCVRVLLTTRRRVKTRLQLEDGLGSATQVLRPLEAEAAARPDSREHFYVGASTLVRTQ